MLIFNISGGLKHDQTNLAQWGIQRNFIKYKKIKKKILSIPKQDCTWGSKYPFFNEISLDAPLCTVWRIMFYTYENVKKMHNFVTNDDIPP